MLSEGEREGSEPGQPARETRSPVASTGHGNFLSLLSLLSALSQPFACPTIPIPCFCSASFETSTNTSLQQRRQRIFYCLSCHCRIALAACRHRRHQPKVLFGHGPSQIRSAAVAYASGLSLARQDSHWEDITGRPSHAGTCRFCSEPTKPPPSRAPAPSTVASQALINKAWRPIASINLRAGEDARQASRPVIHSTFTCWRTSASDPKFSRCQCRRYFICYEPGTIRFCCTVLVQRHISVAGGVCPVALLCPRMRRKSSPPYTLLSHPSMTTGASRKCTPLRNAHAAHLILKRPGESSCRLNFFLAVGLHCLTLT